MEAALTAAIPVLFNRLFAILSKRRPSKEEIEELYSGLRELVKLSQETTYAVNRYIRVEEGAIRAGTHARELKDFFSDERSQESRLTESLRRLLSDRVVRLEKDDLREIHEFTDDFEKAQYLVHEAKSHLEKAIRDLTDAKRAQSETELDYALKNLDELVSFTQTRRDSLMRPLTTSYRVLLNMEKARHVSAD